MDGPNPMEEKLTTRPEICQIPDVPWPAEAEPKDTHLNFDHYI